MPENKIRKLTLAGMFAALAFACFSYLRIEIPMGLGLTGKIYVGHAFILLSALLLGAKYGALSGAIGLALADLLAGYTTSAPPTFLAKFLLGWSTAFAAQHLCHLDSLTDDGAKLKAVTVAATFRVRGECGQRTPDPVQFQILHPGPAQAGGLYQRPELCGQHGHQQRGLRSTHGDPVQGCRKSIRI